jgi:hypothetical protein
MRARALPSFALLVVALPATALLASGCSSSPAAPQSQSTPSAGPASLPACKAPEAAVLPNTDGSLTEADSGAFCLAVGQVLDVFLTVPANSAPGARWSQIKLADASVVGYGNNGVLTPPIGVTAGVFGAERRGVTTLSSSLPNGTTWKVTLVVK